MIVLNRNINNIFFIFVISHLLIWTLTPSLTNKNLPLDTIEALAWGSNLDWGFNKHPPMSAFFSEVFYQIFGAQDWAFYLLSQIFVLVAFYYVFKFASEILGDVKLGLISTFLLSSIYFYNFTTPEFNVNVCQLPFWSLVVYYSWRIYNSKEIKFLDCLLVGIFAAVGFLSKYLFIYLLISIDLLFIYLIFFKKNKKFDFKYLITLEVFLVLLVPHFIWLYNNDFITVFYGLQRSGLEENNIFNHIKYPLIFFFKQIGILIPFFFLIFLLTKKLKFKFNLKDKKFLFLVFVNLVPIVFMILTSAFLGSKIRTMWMTPFYLFFGVFFVYLLRSQISLKRINSFLIGFLFLFFLSPIIYSFVSISQTDKRTDYPGKEIAAKVQITWDQDFDKDIEFVTGNEWNAGNLSYHLKSRPKWEGFTNNGILNKSSQFICIDEVCLGRY
jgi:4-amino-4-deoxy-L-arabinose transferase-like glycosyltransferase